MSQRPLWLAAAPAIFLILWSAGFGIAKLGLAHAEPVTLLALRYLCVVALLAPLALVLRPPFPATPRAWADIAVVGFLIQVVYFTLSYIALKSGLSAGGIAIIVCLQPVVVALAAPRFLGETTGRRGWLGLVLGLAGAAMVIFARSTVAAENPAGIGLAALALLGISGATLWERRHGAPHHPVASNLIQYGVGAAVTLPLAALTETMHIDWSWRFAAVLFYLVVGNSLVALGLLLAMIRAGAVARVSALFYLVPPLSALFAWPLLGEAMPPLAWAGMVLAAGGVALVSRR